MNEKIILYFLITLIVIIAITDSSYATLMTAKFDVNKTLDFWTPERIKSAKPLIPQNIGFRNNTSRAKNAKIKVDADPVSVDPFDNPHNPLNYPVGRLFATDPETEEPQVCTASVFNTDNGNIILTAAHCLFNDDGLQYNNIAFSPGYNFGTPGPLGMIPAGTVAVPAEYNDDPFEFDYGMAKLDFNDPNDIPLKQYTGANGWVLNLAGDNILTTVFGYPQGGDMPNCPRDGLNLCVIVSNVQPGESLYAMPGVNLGDGTSGAPWTINHDPTRNLGYMYGSHSAYSYPNGQSESPIYNAENFQDLLEYVSDN